jgi:3-dehydroquinate dehydratase type I
MVRICVSIPAATTAAVINYIRGLEKPDLMELRLDYASEPPDLVKIRESTSVPLIATARLPSQGGHWAGGERERHKVLISAAKAGFDYVDVEDDSDSLSELVARLRERKVKVIVSRHYLDRAPSLEEALSVHDEAKSVGADIVKIVGTATCPGDCLPCLAYVTREPGNVGFAMGNYGVPSRILSPLMGGAFTYASAGEGTAVAPGQLTLHSLREVYRLMGVEA